jgi:hypothetical protein
MEKVNSEISGMTIDTKKNQNTLNNLPSNPF